MKHLFIYFCFFSLLYSNSTSAQNNTLGNHPSTVKWKYIKNDKIKVIFPDSTLDQAKRIADIITYINKEKKISVGAKSFKLDLLLNTNNVEANGYVALAPFRSEFYATGFQNQQFLGTMNWLDNLSIHEYRHALQFSNTRHGLTNFAYYIGGETAWSLVNTIAIPAWYWEGDAVHSETLLSENGRGRLPSFFEKQRALFLKDRNYNYMQMRNGSFKNLIPDHYTMGYNMINYGRNHYDNNLWARVLAGSSAFRSFYPFSQVLKKETSLTTRDFYKIAYKELKEKWAKELEAMTITPTISITQSSKVVTNYTFPKVVADGSIICLKSSFDAIAKLVQIKDGREKVLTEIGFQSEPYLEMNGDNVCWTEMRNDSRRQEKTYSVIVSYNLKTGKKSIVTHKSKYFSPMFSATGEQIVTVCANTNLANNIKILDAKTGLVLKTIPNERNEFISYPKWIDNENAVVYIAKHNSKLCMLKYDLKNGVTTELMSWTSHSIGMPKVMNNEIYFSASFSGINNVYCLKADGSKQIKAVTSVEVGADLPEVSADGKVLYLSEQTDMGKQLTKINIADGISKLGSNAISITEPVAMKLFDIATNELEKPILNDIPTNEYEVKDYQGLFRGMKLHTWGFTLGTNNSFTIGGSMNNILDDFSIAASARYNGNEQRMAYNAAVTYSKYFLPVTASIVTAERSNTYDLSSFDPTDTNKTLKVDYEEVSKSIGFVVPLSWMHSNYSTSFRLAPTFSTIETRNYSSTPVGYSFINFNFNSAHVGFSFSNIRMRALQNLSAKWSQSVKVDYFKSLDANFTSEQITASVNLSAAGFSQNHGLDFSFRFKKELLSNDYLYGDNFIHARGYSVLNSDKEMVYSANYSFPICYPDFGFAGLIFVKRLHANLFFDGGTSERFGKKLKQNSTGGELIVTLSPLNLATNFGLGFRNSYLLNKDYSNPATKSNFEVFFTMNF
jgi:hypothetical protein